MVFANSPPISSEKFCSAFSDGLGNIIANNPTPGELVLVAGNGMFLDDPVLHNQTERLCLEFAESIVNDRLLTGDEALLRSALEQGLIGGHRTLPERRVGAEGAIFLNAFRALRPAREAGKPITDIKKPYDSDGFNFHKVPSEVFWHGKIGGVNTGIYYNKYPLAPYHALLVPDQELNLPQFLTERYHDFAWEVMSLASPGTALGYNSLGAFASINHLHFQLVVGNRTVPEATQAGGDQNKPIPHGEFTSPEESWEYIQTLHSANRAYNLIYQPGSVKVFPRKFQGTYPQPAWTDGFAWYELGGNFVARQESDFHAVSERAISHAFEQMAVAA